MTKDIIKMLLSNTKKTKVQLSKESGIAKCTIRTWETGEFEPLYMNVESFAKACGYKIVFQNIENGDFLEG